MLLLVASVTIIKQWLTGALTCFHIYLNYFEDIKCIVSLLFYINLCKLKMFSYNNFALLHLLPITYYGLIFNISKSILLPPQSTTLFFREVQLDISHTCSPYLHRVTDAMTHLSLSRHARVNGKERENKRKMKGWE